ncbi:MAG: hypothetical protein NT135_02635 [Candidatus Berkelbacteria bacterium]|nr:hypothetical protein [Candidatus Berkelbacteria bacterium]
MSTVLRKNRNGARKAAIIPVHSTISRPKPMTVEQAKDAFRWRLRPVIGFVQSSQDPSLKKIWRLEGFVHLTKDLPDVVSVTRKEEAKEAYKLLLLREKMGDREVKAWWQALTQLETFKGIRSFSDRLKTEGNEQFMFIIWVDARYNKEWVDVVEELDAILPGILGSKKAA